MTKQQRAELRATMDDATRLLHRGNYGEAMAQFEYARAIFGTAAALQIDGIELAAVLNWILACAQPLADWPAMVEASQALISIDPEACDPWIRLAIGLKQIGDLAGATNAVLHAIELDPESSDARYEAACQLAVAGNSAAALERVAEAVERGASKRALVDDDELASLRALPRFQQLTRARN